MSSRFPLPALVASTALALCGGLSAPAQPQSVQILVGFTSAGIGSSPSLEEKVGARRVATIAPLGVHVLAVDAGSVESALATLRDDPRVRYAQRDGLVHAARVPNDEFWQDEWSPVKTNALQAWDLTTGSSPVVIAVLDTGVDPTQPDLQGKLVPGFDYVNNDTNTADDNGHGTGVAGIIAANSNNRIGVAGYCWECRLMPVKVLGADGSGTDSELAQGVVWATDHGARVINASLGGPQDDLTLSAAAAYAQQHGVLVVAAAGNDGSSLLDYPAALPNVVSVGASNQDDQLYSFSNSGAALAAPGENATTATGGGYEYFLGTSSAAPVVSGIAGLAYAVAPDASPAQITRALESSAHPIPGVVYGRVDAYGTVRAFVSGETSSPASTGSGKQDRARTTRVIVGRLTRLRRSRTFGLKAGSGTLQATLTLSRRGAVRLRLLTANGSVVASARGSKVVTLSVSLRGGSYRLRLRELRRATLPFKLVLSYPR